MKKIILLFILAIVVILVISGGIFVFAKDSPIFDVFFSDKQKEERALERMAKLYPEKLGDFSLYARGPEKVRKNKEECNEINETLNKDNLEIKGTVCARITIGEYRNAENETIFVQIMKITKGKDIPGVEYLFGKISGAFELKGYEIMRPENHEIGWFPEDSSEIDVVLTQEGVARKNPDGGESMLYQNKATGENPVTQYFLSKFSPSLASAVKQQNDNLNTNNSSLSNRISSDYNVCVQATEQGINGQKICSVIKSIQEKGINANYSVYRDSRIRKSETEGAVAQVDIDIIFGQGKSNGDIIQMTSPQIATDTINKISLKNTDYNKIDINGKTVLKFLRNGEITFVFSNNEMIYELQNIKPSFETQFIEVIKVILS